MAGKSRRVASRQSQLNRRKKRQQRGPSGIPSTEPRSVGVAQDTSEGVVTETTPDAVSELVATAVTTTPPVPITDPPVVRGPSRTRDDRTSAYTHMGSEIRRILVMGGVGFAVLVILTFALPPL